MPGPLPDNTIRSPADLVRSGLVPPEVKAGLYAVAARYAIAIPPALRALIETAEDRSAVSSCHTPRSLSRLRTSEPIRSAMIASPL